MGIDITANMEEDEYASVTKRPLKLTSDKRKVNKTKAKPSPSDDQIAGAPPDSNVIITKTTKAEAAFLARQAEVAEKRILKKASKTHKQRVEEFNKHLDSLSEHYDIPKVSWTK